MKSVVQYELANSRQDQIKWTKQKNSNPNVALKGLLDIWANLRSIQDGRRNILDTNLDIQLKVYDQFHEISNLSNEIVAKCDDVDELIAEKISELTSCWDDCE